MIFAISLIVVLLLLIIIGAPVFLSMGAASLMHYLDTGRAGTMMVLNQRLFDGLSSFPFLAVPMFLLAGEIMTRGGLTGRLITLAQAFIGHFRGGLAQVNILSSVFFGGISGSAFADVAAIGGVMIPGMKKEGYPGGFAGAVTAASATLSPLIPPSIVLIVYGAAYGVSIGALFAAGLSAAFVLALGFLITSYLVVRRMPNLPMHPRATLCELWRAIRLAGPSLLLPIIILGGIFSGSFTATESAAIAVLYSLVLVLFVYRTISFRELPGIFESAVVSSAAIALLVGVSIAFSYIMVQRDIPAIAISAILTIADGPIMINFVIFVMLFVAGLFVDRNANILMLGTILIPIFTIELGYSSIHTAIIIVMTLGIGHLTPPVGGALLTAALVGRVPLMNIVFAIWPFILVKILVTVLIIFVPAISETLPRFLGLGSL